MSREIQEHYLRSLEADNDRLEEENNRLRSTLEAILKYCHIGYGDLALEYARVLAWEALEGGETDGTERA